MTAPSRARILVVHDEPTVASELAEHLRGFGYDVTGAAASGDEALGLAERSPPDLVLLEVSLDGARDGVATANVLQDRLGVPVVYLSGRTVDLRSAVEVALQRTRLEREQPPRDASERRRLQRQAELSDRLAALGTLAVGVTQEIDHPLAFVIGNQQHARRELGALRELCEALEPRRRELALDLVAEIGSAISDAMSGAERVRTIVSQLKKLGRPPASLEQAFDVRSALDAALAVTSAQLGGRARLIREFGACPKVRADELRLTQVFVNLLLNAAQAIAPGNVNGNEIRIVTSTGLHGGALIEVRDTGAGIPEAVLPRIFEPFFTTRDPEAGSGLGLSISHGIVTSFAGTIEVESRVGKGSTFRVVLPACPESGAALATRGDGSPRRASPRPELCARLLFVDDEPILLDALTRALEGHYAVARAPTALTALDLLAAGNEYDLLVCDLMMPGMTGIDLFHALEQRFPDAASRTVFMTGGAFTHAAQAFIGAPGRRVLEKPFSNDELFAFIAACLNGAARGPAPGAN